MDIVLNFFRIHLLQFYIAGIIILIIKIILLFRISELSFTEFILSFFTFYNLDEIESAHLKERVSFMRWNNRVNFFFYLWVLIMIFYFVVTLNTN